MLSASENARLTQVGPGTQMGALMRQYWIPALRSTELPNPDSDPVRVMLLGEKLIAFRDSSGKVGLIEDACPHRGASLFFGRNEECGLRCVYHGWKFDRNGNCVDMPNEPPGSEFKANIKARTYPCVEKGNVVWTYMGPREVPPPMPLFEVLDYADENILTNAFQFRCNWVQAMEGNSDPTHASFLHAGHEHWEDLPPGILRIKSFDRAMRDHKVMDSAGGVMSGAGYRDPDQPGMMAWALRHWLFPFYSLNSTGPLGKKIAIIAAVPQDDHHTIQYVLTMQFHKLVFAMREYNGEMLQPNGTGWFDRFRWRQNVDNDYGIDRESQRTSKKYTGIDGGLLEDIAVCESMGPVVDRTKEHLGSADAVILRVRRRLLAAAKALEETGAIPPGVDDPQVYRVRSGYVSLAEGVDWLEGSAAGRVVPDEPMPVPDAEPADKGLTNA